MKIRLVILPLILGSIALGWVVRDVVLLPFMGDLAKKPADRAATPAAATPSEATETDTYDVVALGRLEPSGRIISIAAVPGDRVERLAVDEQAVVKKGQPLAYLDSHALREIEVASLESQLKEAESRRASEEKLADARITTATLAVEQAKAQQFEITAQEKRIEGLRSASKQAQKEKDRYQQSYGNATAYPQYEQLSLAADKADAELHAAESLLEKAVKMRDLALDGANSDLAAAKATKDQTLGAIPVKSLQKSLELAKAQLDRTILTAPCAGTIIKISARPGELTGPTPILQLADLNQMVATAEVYETDVRRLRVGQVAVVTSKAFAAPYDTKGLHGKIVRIGWVIGRAELKNLDPLAPTDRRVVEVRVALDDEGSTQAAHLSNLQVDVKFVRKQ